MILLKNLRESSFFYIGNNTPSTFSDVEVILRIYFCLYQSAEQTGESIVFYAEKNKVVPNEQIKSRYYPVFDDFKYRKRSPKRS